MRTEEVSIFICSRSKNVSRAPKGDNKLLTQEKLPLFNENW
jgi:hypothetical protein